MPTVEGLQFAYALYALPPGRLPFGRWRWELWHGSTMVAAGWRLSRPQAGRALRVHAAEFGHRLFGLPAARAPSRDGRRRPPPRRGGAARDRLDHVHARAARARGAGRRDGRAAVAARGSYEAVW